MHRQPDDYFPFRPGYHEDLKEDIMDVAWGVWSRDPSLSHDEKVDKLERLFKDLEKMEYNQKVKVYESYFNKSKEPEKDKTKDEIKDYGFLNDWVGNPPDAVKRCWGQGHETEEVEIGKSLRKNTCPICKIQYTVDSSD